MGYVKSLSNIFFSDSLKMGEGFPTVILKERLFKSKQTFIIRRCKVLLTNFFKPYYDLVPRWGRACSNFFRETTVLKQLERQMTGFHVNRSRICLLKCRYYNSYDFLLFRCCFFVLDVFHYGNRYYILIL